MLLVEGAGGLLCPLAEGVTVADVAAKLGYPLLIVARAGLGTVGHTLLTLEVAAARGLPVAGVLLNETAGPEPQAETNAALLAAHSGVAPLGVVHRDGNLPPGVRWNDLTAPPRGGSS